MMKKVLTALCAALTLLFLIGCPRQQTEQTQPEEVTQVPTEWVVEIPSQERIYQGVELTFLARWEESDPRNAVLTQAAEVFEAQTGAVVNIQRDDSQDAAADIYQLPGSALSDYADTVLDLTQMAQTAGYGDKSFTVLTEQVISRCGFLGAIPQTPYVGGFYYNRETFETSGIIQSPRTWESFLAVCDQLVSGGWQPLTLDSENADDLLVMQLTQYLGAEGAQAVATGGGWTGEQALQAMTDIYEFVASGYLATGTPGDRPAGQNKLALSNSAMCYGTNALCTQVEAATDTDLGWGMFPYPGAGGGEPVITVDADVLAVSSRCASPQAAFDFIMLLVCGEFDQLRVDLTDGIPADPANESAIDGAVQALQVAQVLEIPQVEWTENQQKTILKLWKGNFEGNDAFSKAMDALYP